MSLPPVAAQHDPALIALAAMICFLLAGITMLLSQRAARDRQERRLSWLALRALAAGVGSWAASFIAMLAFDPGLPAGYDHVLVGLSLLAAMGAALAALRLAGDARPWVAKGIGGAIAGCGFAVTNLVVMLAYRPQGEVQWDSRYLVASLFVGAALGVAARQTAGRRPNLLRGMSGAAVITVAVLVTHFVAAAALVITPDASVALPPELALRPVLMGAVIVLALVALVSVVSVGASDASNRRGALQRMRGVIDHMPAAVALFDAEDRLVLWNDQYAEMAPGGADLLRPGQTFAEMLGRTSYDKDYVEAIVRKRRERGMNEYPLPDGRWMRVENRPMEDGGIISVAVDVTELRRQADALALARDEAHAANRAKTEFLANISHEIRTPLNGVYGVAEVLALTTLNDKQQQMVEIIRSSAGQVDVLLGEILELSRVDSREIGTSSVRFRLGDELRTVAIQHQPPAAAKGIALNHDLVDADVEVEGDASRLRRIVDILLGNAVKFTEAGGVTLAARATSAGNFRIEVRDTGIGFDPSQKERLFERFAQADGSATRRFGGAGLGLAIARECAAILQGQLDCHSSPGEGSVFTLDVPLRSTGEVATAPAPPTEQRTTEAPTADAEAETPFRVLIVDDNATNRHVLELILSQIGAELVSVEDGRQAVDAYAERPFDVVLMDIQMPVMDGLAATREIRRIEQDRGAPRTPVVIVSANCQPEHIQAGREAGADDHLAKPVNAAALMSALEAACEPAERQAA